jgi:hypothetical protein
MDANTSSNESINVDSKLTESVASHAPVLQMIKITATLTDAYVASFNNR